MALDSMQEILDAVKQQNKPFWQIVRDTDVDERQVTPEQSFEKMLGMIQEKEGKEFRR